jgi:hypothetical protein
MRSYYHTCVHTDDTHRSRCLWAGHPRLHSVHHKVIDPRFQCSWTDHPTTPECYRLIGTYQREVFLKKSTKTYL